MEFLRTCGIFRIGTQVFRVIFTPQSLSITLVCALASGCMFNDRGNKKDDGTNPNSQSGAQGRIPSVCLGENTKQCWGRCVERDPSTTGCGLGDNDCAPCPGVISAEMKCTDNSDKCEIVRCLHGLEDCDKNAENGCEERIGSDSHCAKCNDSCLGKEPKQTCLNGNCQENPCDRGWLPCGPDGGCTSRIDDPNTCGSCAVQCNQLGNERVESWSCRLLDNDKTYKCFAKKCKDGWMNCDATSDTSSDTSRLCATSITTENNCGKCGNVCNYNGFSNQSNVLATCVAGQCEYTCQSGWLTSCNNKLNEGIKEKGCTVEVSDCSDAGFGDAQADAISTDSSSDSSLDSSSDAISPDAKADVPQIESREKASSEKNTSDRDND